MARSRKVTIRFNEKEYITIKHAARRLDMSVSEYLRHLTLRDPAVVSLAVMDYGIDLLLKDLVGELDRWRRYWREHPEKLLQVPPRPPGEET
jgi:hypothetical protein